MKKNVKIPGSKFVKASWYAFIVRFGKQIEFYFHPDAPEEEKILKWLEQHGFKQNQVTPQQYTALLSQQRSKQVRSILEQSSNNGAYEIEADCNFDTLPDKDGSEKELDSPLVIAIAKQVTEAIDNHLVNIEEKLQEKIEAAGNKSQIEQYETQVADLINQVKDQQITINKLEVALQATQEELARTKVLFGSEASDPFEVFEEEDEIQKASETSHFNNPFDKENGLSEDAITDESQYDDSSYDKIVNQPAEPGEDLVGGSSSDDDDFDLDIDDSEVDAAVEANNVPTTAETLNKALDDLDIDEVDADLTRISKSSSNGHAAVKK